MKRQFPRWSQLAPVLRLRRPALTFVDRRLANVASIADLRSAARRRVPKAVFDYVDGAASDELGLDRMRQTFRRVEWRPAALRDVSTVDPSTLILGRPADLPIVFAPTGFTRMMHSEGEVAVARAAGLAGIPYTLSTMGTTTIERLSSEANATRRWFQLYLWRDRGASADFVARARESGFEALVLTIDTPVPGMRLKDTRNGMTIPPSLSPRTFLDGASRPGWWFDLVTTEPLRFATAEHFGGTLSDIVTKMFDPAATIKDVEWLRELWPGPLIIKGIQSVEGAQDVVKAGADALVLSNHGGRQLDKAPVPLELLPAVRQEVGSSASVFLDGGIMSGADVLASVALGADACLVGRAYLYGLMAGGARGVQKAADILTSEICNTMALLGATTIADLTPDTVRLRSR
jgi:L-lactate dehydrogenase (cytochrome)